MSRRHIAAIVGALFSLFFVALSLRNIELAGVWSTLVTAKWWPWFVLAPTLYCLGQVVRGVRCREVLRVHRLIPVTTATNVVVIGYAANNVLPARLGEVVRAYVLGRKAQLSISLSLAATFLERVMDGLAILLLLFVASWFTPLATWGRDIMAVAGTIFAVAVVGLIVLMVATETVLDIVDFLARPFSPALRARLRGVLERAISSTKCLRDPAIAGRIAVLSVIVWLVEASMFLAVLPAFSLRASPLQAIVTMAITNLGVLLPSSPGYVGPFHYFCMKTVELAGAPRETALAYAIMTHLLYYVPVTLWGFGALFAYGISLGSAARDAEGEGEARTPVSGRAPASEGDASPPFTAVERRTLDAVIKTMKPTYPVLPSEVEARVLAGVSVFVSAQVALMPSFLRAPYRLAIVSFELCALARFGRPFSRLDPSRQGAYLRFWSDGPIGPMRDFVKLIRSCAVLAYFDHPEVRAQLDAETLTPVRERQVGG